MNQVEMLALGDALARTAELVRPDECIPFRGYLERVLGSTGQIPAVFGGAEALAVSVDGRLVDGPGSTVPVTAASRVVLCRRQGPALDVLTRGMVRRICLN
jgi:hypothetical protein